MGGIFSNKDSKDTNKFNENGMIAGDVESGLSVRPQMQQIESNTDNEINDNDKEQRCCPNTSKSNNNNNNNNNFNNNGTESEALIDKSNETEIKKLKRQINELKAGIKDRDTKVSNLENDVKRWKDRVTNLSNDLRMTSDDKYKKLLNENIKLQENLDEIYGGVPDSSEFPDIEYIKKRFDNTKKQSHNNLYTLLFDELEEYYDASSGSNESKDDGEISVEVYQVLYRLVFECYDEMMEYKDEKIKKIIENLESETKYVTKDTKDKIWLIVQPLLQHEWSIFVKNKYSNSNFKPKNRKKQKKKEPKVDVEIMNKHIDDIYKKIIEKFPFINDVLEFSQQKAKIEESFKKYISECCQICWLMILQKPGLLFYPDKFKADEINGSSDDISKDIMYSAKKFNQKFHEPDGMEESNIDINYEIQYYTWPSLIKKPKIKNGKHVLISRTKIYVPEPDYSDDDNN
mmetsp:Transcript_64459/g.78820  ORF Transcript_64459/g.78820 Transcript_64459/m.78820 type:complete len:459 (+) Transcript_64459:69-1445(+)